MHKKRSLGPLNQHQVKVLFNFFKFFDLKKQQQGTDVIC